jgi:hypothetical protein
MSAAGDASELMLRMFRILAQVARRRAWRNRRGSSERCRCEVGLHGGLTRPDAGRHPPEPPGWRQLPRTTSSPRVRAMIMVLRWFRGRRSSAFGTAAPARFACGTSESASPAGSCRGARGRCSPPVPCQGRSDQLLPRRAPFWNTNLHQHPEGPFASRIAEKRVKYNLPF